MPKAGSLIVSDLDRLGEVSFRAKSTLLYEASGHRRVDHHLDYIAQSLKVFLCRPTKLVHIPANNQAACKRLIDRLGSYQLNQIKLSYANLLVNQA
jgi:hypothetical protein